jgi:ubiquinone/menaquinone biosynthesis C-methylase UbiE
VDMNVQEFDWIARNILAPVYPVIAGQIREKAGISEGVCLDLGSGGGYLSIALAGITDMEFILLDPSAEMTAIAERNVRESGLTGRARVMTADVHRIPLDDETVDLVVSRGSFFFWEDRVRAFKEVRRVLKAGGRARIGGGMGSSELMREINKKMETVSAQWKQERKGGESREAVYREALRDAGFEEFTVCRDDDGFWMDMVKKERS